MARIHRLLLLLAPLLRAAAEPLHTDAEPPDADSDLSCSLLQTGFVHQPLPRHRGNETQLPVGLDQPLPRLEPGVHHGNETQLPVGLDQPPSGPALELHRGNDTQLPVGFDQRPPKLEPALHHSNETQLPAGFDQRPPKLEPALHHSNETLLPAGSISVELAQLLPSYQLSYDFHMAPADIPVKNKVILAILELLGLGMCGIDRCYMGQTCIGILKGLTLGGLTVWAMLDYFGIVITCLSMSPSINVMGIRANFSDNTINAAFVLTLVVVVVKCCCGGTLLWLQHHLFGGAHKIAELPERKL